MGCMNMPDCLDKSGRCFARTESGKCKALSEAPARCRFKKPDKNKPEARRVTDREYMEIRKEISDKRIRYPIQKERDFNRGIDASLEVLKKYYKDNKYGYWNWSSRKDAWICNKCGKQNDNLPDDPSIVPMNWSGSRFCPHCGSKMGQ